MLMATSLSSFSIFLWKDTPNKKIEINMIIFVYVIFKHGATVNKSWTTKAETYY
jgi:hypothetical protein